MMLHREAREGETRVRDARLAWRQWGEDSEPAVLALHGWLDNAASFDALAPLLHGYRVIALDLPGHGFSDHRAASGSYNIWDDLPDLLGLVRTLDIRSYALIGHSRGAFIANMLAAIEGQRVRSLVLLDGFLPPQFNAADTVRQLGSFAHDYGLRTARAARVYASVDAAVEARVKASGIDPRAARMLVPRSLRPVAGGYSWGTDPRLRYASALKLGTDHAGSVLGALRMPGLLLVANGNAPLRIAQNPAISLFRHLQVEHIEGCHHCHMLDQAAPIAARVLEFWKHARQSE